MAVNGATPITPESYKEMKKELELIKKLVIKPIDESILLRQQEIKEQFFIATVDKAVKDSLKEVVTEIRDTIEEKKFNRKIKSDILEKLAKLTGDTNGS
jgi:phosphoenolpyruvate synthase/pyruvate phosphate dikinase